MSAKKKAPLIKWWSAARGSGDDFTYYKKSRKMVTAVQVIAVVFGFLVTALKAIAFLFICTAAFAVMTLPAVDKPSFLNDNAALLSLWRELIPMLGVLFVTAVFVFVVEKKTIGVSIVKNPVRGIAYGFLPGCIMLGVPLLCLVFMGDISFGEQTGIPSLWAWFVAVALNAVTQEYLVRGYLFSLFKKRSMQPWQSF